MNKLLWGLADGNNFYASCERLFRPDLLKKPIAILSNNDGCVIARSEELKAMGVKMGTPKFKINEEIKNGTITAFSSNYELYGELHNRLMHTLSRFTPDIEIYSIDESWLLFENFNYNMPDYAEHIVAETFKLVGIPVSLGIAPTKTLAKVANKLAKKDMHSKGAKVLQTQDEIRDALSVFPVQDLWGVGRSKFKALTQLNIKTALEFSQLPGGWVKKNFSITGFRTWQELRGFPCHQLLEETSSKDAIATGRTFGNLLTDYDSIKEALVNHSVSCSQKLRKQKSYASYVNIRIETNRFRDDLPRYVNTSTVRLLQPTNNAVIIAKATIEAFDKIFKKGIFYNRCSVTLLGLSDELTGMQESLFEQHDRAKSDTLMTVLDQINIKYGKNTLKIATQGTGKTWALRNEHQSPRYLTQLDDFIKVTLG